eukprot:6210344-Pleurochrysis_carterae.AAC.1
MPDCTNDNALSQTLRTRTRNSAYSITLDREIVLRTLSDFVPAYFFSKSHPSKRAPWRPSRGTPSWPSEWTRCRRWSWHRSTCRRPGTCAASCARPPSPSGAWLGAGPRAEG